MGPFAIRQVILSPFPFSDLEGGLQRNSHARAEDQLKSERHQQVVESRVAMGKAFTFCHTLDEAKAVRSRTNWPRTCARTCART